MKGVSNVVTAAVLVSVAVAATGVYSNWLPDFARETTSNLVDNQNRNIECEKARATIENPTYRESSSQLDFGIKNSGTIRFSENLTVAVLNSSEIIKIINVGNLGVSETKEFREVLEKKPELLLASSEKCPEISVRRSQISFQ